MITQYLTKWKMSGAMPYTPLRRTSMEKELMQAMLEKVEIYKEKRKDGCWVRSITLKFPLPIKDGEVREIPLESLTTLESIVCLIREKG